MLWKQSLDSTWCYNNKNKRKRGEILLIIIQSLYKQHPDIQESIRFSIADVCQEEIVFPEKIFLLLVIVIDDFRKSLGNITFCLSEEITYVNYKNWFKNKWNPQMWSSRIYDIRIFTLFRMNEGRQKASYQFFACNFYKRKN